MSIRERWRGMDTGEKVAVGLVAGFVALVVMVVVLVLLAAIVGSFVLGLGTSADVSAPQASFAVSYEQVNDGYRATITHDGGDTLSASNVAITTPERTVSWPAEDDDITAGDSATVSVPPDAELRVVWHGPDDTRQVLLRDTSPL